MRLHGPKVRPHGSEWDVLMRIVGFEPQVRARLSHDLQATPQSELATRPIYEHRCPVC